MILTVRKDPADIEWLQDALFVCCYDCNDATAMAAASQPSRPPPYVHGT